MYEYCLECEGRLRIVEGIDNCTRRLANLLAKNKKCTCSK